MVKEELWQAVLAQIQLNISQANFATWFKDTGITDYKEGQIIVSTPNSFAKEWLENKYGKTIFKIFYNLDKEIKEVKYVVGKSELKIIRKPSVSVSGAGQLEFEEFKIDKETNLNPRYSFENFIVGSFNELAHAAGWQVSKKPGLVYNPLFIYGGVGLGKTHLLQSVGNAVIKNFSQKKVKYIPSEKFTTGVVSSIKNHEIERFKNAYKAIDVLILDDVQFLAGKEKTQEEFFHIFNALYEENKQIIISSDRPPKAIPALTERLRSRFEGGMIGDISYPDYETRIAILKTKIQEKGINFSDEVLDYIAVNIQKNIRELEGALNRLITYEKINNQPPDLEIAKSLLKTLFLSPNKVANYKKIIQAVSEFYDLKEKDMFSISRKKEVVKPRQIAMFLLRELLKSSYPFIGKKFNGKDHTTVIHSCEKIIKELKNNENLNDEIDLIKQRIFSA
ncbi:MAG TPA: chromosomal replication initiator protein DnaA [Patescibacteria group bacterium]|nr:chromosomal replication initiator protein DnaA [Patescibacteria group bacterium]